MSPGLRFCSVDLHVHTPASQCFKGPDVTPNRLIEQAIGAGMAAIAITDHNSAAWVDCVKEAALGKDITVFPGVEITVQPGVHVLAIFPQDRTGSHVNDLLSGLGLGTDQRGNPEALVTQYGVQEVVRIIRQAHGALPILAHIDAPKGVWHELRDRGQTLIQLWQAAEFCAVEILGTALPDEIGQNPFPYRPAFYWSSDNPHPDDSLKHSDQGIGARYSRFKLDTPITWEGLRQCFQDPEVRIRSGSADSASCVRHPTIEAVQVEGGFLSGLNLSLNPNLNCLIGGRGTGKSTLLELIRYACDLQPKTAANRSQAQSILDGTFPAGSGSRVSVRFRLEDGTIYWVERIAGQPPSVYRGDGEELLDLAPGDILPVQAYGQKEIYEISQDPTFQLNLLDNYVADALKPLLREEEELLRQLRDNATALLQREADIASAEDQLTGLGAVEEELRRMEQRSFVSRVKQKQLYDQEKRLLDQAEKRITEVSGALGTLLDELGQRSDVLASELAQELPNRDVLNAQKELLRAIDEDISESLTTLVARIARKWGEGETDRQQWEAGFARQNEAYQELLREFQSSGEGLDADRYIRLQDRKEELGAVCDSLAEHRAKARELSQHRSESLEKLRSNRRRQFETRRAKVDELSGRLEGTVRITLHPEGNRKNYEELLGTIFEGLNVRTNTRSQLANAEYEQPEQEAQRMVQFGGQSRYLIPRIPRYRDPIDLAKAIRDERARAEEQESILEDQVGISSEAMQRNIARLSEEALFELETSRVPDLPIIELRVASGELGYRPLSALSVGQKCTALLSLILLESPAPLLIDQPEDDLDNQFIFDQIVATLRHEKERRQFLVATHNANIPVSGDAELILVLQADEGRGWVDDSGIGSIDAASIKDSVERILEGGEAAFQLRKEKYGLQ